LEGGETLSFDEVFWATEPSPAPWLADTGLKLDAHGFVEVDATLQSTSHPGVFAAGDVASLRGFSLPKAGVHAVRQGPTLSGNLRRAVSGEPLQPYKPQSQVLSLISTGERYAVGTRNGLMFEGAWVWQCKDWLDRRYMAKFKNLSAGALAQ
jgi:selenide,water dikinase